QGCWSGCAGHVRHCRTCLRLQGFLPRERVAHYNAGRMLHDLPTPSIEICAETFERNLRKLADYTKEHGLGLRPHSKTHKSTFIGKKERAAGAIGLTVAKGG